MPTTEKEKNGIDINPENADILTEAEDEGKNKKKKKEKNKQKQKKERKGIGKIVPILILLLIFGAIIAILVFNVLNIRDKYLAGTLQKIPIINNLLPIGETPASDNQYAGLTTDQLVAQIEQLNAELEKQQQENLALEDINTDYATQIAQLKILESQQLQYKQDKAAFDQMIALGDPAAYSTFYESISPENNDALYQQTQQKIQNQKDIKNYVGDFSAMDEQSAAAILEQMMITEMDLVAMIFQYLDSEISAAILQSMTPENAASVAKRIAPTPMPEITPLPVFTDDTALPTDAPLE